MNRKLTKALLIAATMFSLGMGAFAAEPNSGSALLLGSGRAANSDEPQNVIKWKPLNLAVGAFTFQYERAFSEHGSFALDLTYLGLSYNTNTGNASGSAKMTLLGISPEARYYPWGPAPHGFYLAGFFEYYTLGLSFSGTDLNSGASSSASLSGASAIGGGVLLGYQFLIGGHFSIDINGGFRDLSFSTPSTWTVSNSNGPSSTENVPSLKFSGALPAGSFALGWAF